MKAEKNNVKITAARLARWLAPLLWMGVIFSLSAQPTLPSLNAPGWDVLLKKTGHFVVYAILAALYAWALKDGPVLTRQQSALSLGLVALYALSDELHQGFVPGRNPALSDWAIDLAGALTARYCLLRVRGFGQGGPTAPR